MILSLLLAAHFLGDFIVQTDEQAIKKTTSWKHMAQHVGGYHIVMAMLLFFLTNLAWLPLMTVLVVSAVTHGFIDRRWPVRRLLEITGSPNFAKLEWGVIATDQALHLSILCLLAWAVR